MKIREHRELEMRLEEPSRHRSMSNLKSWIMLKNKSHITKMLGDFFFCKDKTQKIHRVRTIQSIILNGLSQDQFLISLGTELSTVKCRILAMLTFKEELHFRGSSGTTSKTWELFVFLIFFHCHKTSDATFQGLVSKLKLRISYLKRLFRRFINILSLRFMDPM